MNIFIQRVALWLAVLMSTLSAAAYDFESGGIYYNVTSFVNLEVEVTSGDNKYSGDVVIPATVSYNNRTLSVTTIRKSAFWECTSLTSVTIPNSVTSIGESAFRGCTNLTSVAIPNSVTSIEESTFKECSRLTSVTIPNSVTTIGNYAFQECSRLASVTIPNSVTTIGESAFRGCTNLTSVAIPNSVTSIEESTFKECSRLASVTIPNSVTTIDDAAFSGCSSLTSVTIPNSVTTIGGSAFSGCSSLASVTIPNSVTTIKEWAFYGCRSITEFIIPDNVQSVGERVFANCSSLKKLQIGSGISKMGSIVSRICKNWFTKKLNDLPPIESIYINDSDNYLDVCALAEDSYAVYYGTFSLFPLKEAYVGRPLVWYSYYDNKDYPPFKNNETLEKIEFGGSCTEVYSLYGCKSLKTLILGEKITRVETGISEDKLTEIFVKATTPPACGSFENKTYMNTTLYIPEGSLAAYQEAENWKNFWNIVEYDFPSMNAIQTVSREKAHVYVNGDVIVVNQPDSNLMYDIYDLSGRTVYHGNDNSVSGLSNGIYIVKVLGESFKVAVK